MSPCPWAEPDVMSSPLPSALAQRPLQIRPDAGGKSRCKAGSFLEAQPGLWSGIPLQKQPGSVAWWLVAGFEKQLGLEGRWEPGC